MARIPAIGAGGVAAKPWRVLQGPGAVEIGAMINNDPTTIGTTRQSVGLTEGNIEWNANIELAVLTSDQMYNPHSAIETAWAHQLTLTLDQVDIWNLALAMSYDQDACPLSSLLTLDGYQPSSYRCMRLITEGAKDTAATAQVTQNLDFWKVKVVGSGAVVFGRTAKTGAPIIIHGLGNSSDQVGTVSVSSTVTKPTYE